MRRPYWKASRSVSIMSTSDLALLTPEIGSLDIGVLSDLANQFFRGLEGEAPQAPGPTPGATPAEVYRAETLPSSPSVPSSAAVGPGGGGSGPLWLDQAAISPFAPTVPFAPSLPNSVALSSPFDQGGIGGLGNSTSQFYFLESVPQGAPHGGGNPAHGHGLSLGPAAPFDVNLIRQDFPILSERVNGRHLVWLDNAATTQKPRSVIERLKYFYEHENSNVHRGAHTLAARATDAYEAAREKVRGFLNAGSVNEIIFVRGTTEGINLIAKSWGAQNVGKGDEIIISWLEHHANIVPWQQLAALKGAVLKVIPVDDSGQVILSEYAKLLSSKTKIVSFTQVSNALGTVTPAKTIVEMAHAAGAKVLVDGAQSVSHMRVDVQALDADWFVFSGHKVFGPTGIGVVYGKEHLLNETQPWQGGGNMIKDVTFEHTEYHAAPTRFEAGTGNIADAVGLGAAIDYVTRLGMEAIHHHEQGLLSYTTALLRDIPGLRIIGTAADKAGVLSFVIKGLETEKVGQALAQDGIAVRSGHHCAQPILRRFGLESSVRPSFAFYNTCSDIDALVASVRRIASTRRLV